MDSENQAPPENLGVLGDGALKAGRDNLRLARKALRENWPLTPEIRQLLVNQMTLIAGKSPKERNRIAAMKALVSADQVNVRRELGDQAAGIMVVNAGEGATINQTNPVLVIEVEKDHGQPGTNGKASQ